MHILRTSNCLWLFLDDTISTLQMDSKLLSLPNGKCMVL